MFATVGLAEWIIGDTCLVFSLLHSLLPKIFCSFLLLLNLFKTSKSAEVRICGKSQIFLPTRPHGLRWSLVLMVVSVRRSVRTSVYMRTK